MNKSVIESIVIATVLTGASYIIGLFFGYITADSVNWVEALAVFTSYSCTYLCVRESRINYPIGAVSVLAYMVLFYQLGLYSSMLLQIYLFPTLLYGWYYWRADTDKRPVARLTFGLPLVIIVTLSIIVWVICQYISNYLGAEMAQWDSIILILSIIAQFMLDRKILENWIVWFAVNVLSIYVYFSAGGFIAGIQYIVFLTNTLFGFYCWYRSYRAENPILGTEIKETV